MSVRTECYKKRAYPTMERAKRAEKSMNTRKPKESFTAYPCYTCGMYHVGHTRKKKGL